ncbi:hypothetical protein HPB52_023341 [Rhipicephalus sanguineus]|uniref:Uncharacterized protein n=1 Tax=Rhipicephalus sanguineus TaxID=34632 RepID=A0A9D4T518_RHISA|nr:hypothetical protein HPB52_023341 [Rhipicephalus sanguineus]
MMLYWSSANHHFLSSESQSGPRAEVPSASYKAVSNTKRMLDKELPDCDVDDDPPARITERLTETQLTPEERKNAEGMKTGERRHTKTDVHEMPVISSINYPFVFELAVFFLSLRVFLGSRQADADSRDSRKKKAFFAPGVAALARDTEALGHGPSSLETLLHARRCEDPGPRLPSRSPPSRPRPPPATRRFQALLSRPSTSVQLVLHVTRPTRPAPRPSGDTACATSGNAHQT